jgi:phosphatidylethanolamine/phosphatidyl-N-methylethanolamine N-methyltransferase
MTDSNRKHWSTFATEFIQRPFATGSLVPSSSHLAKMMIQQADIADAEAVLEYGPGTGAFTGHILPALNPRAKFAAIEINPQLAAVFRTAHPDVQLFEDSVENVRAICDSMQIESVDCVISGLPWAFFSEDLQVTLLDQMMRVLKPGSRFVTFGYLQGLAMPAGRRLSALLPTYFTSISRSPVVWLNFPPAFVYRCLK